MMNESSVRMPTAFSHPLLAKLLLFNLSIIPLFQTREEPFNGLKLQNANEVKNK